VFFAAMLQTVILSSLVVVGGAPDVLLVVVVELGLIRGSVPASSGFMGGLRRRSRDSRHHGYHVTVLRSRFWAGRYGETSGRDRRFAPVIAVGTITLLAGLFGYVLHYMLGEQVVARQALVTALIPALVLNVALALPLCAFVRRVVGEGERPDVSARSRGLGRMSSEPVSAETCPVGTLPSLTREFVSRIGSRRSSALAASSAASRLVAFTILFFRLWSLQVLSGDEHLAAAQNNQLRLVRVEAPRGPILDRRGRVVVSNVAGTAVQLWVGDMPKEGRAELVQRLARVLDVSSQALARDVEDRRGDPLTPITVKTSVGEEQVNFLYEHQAEFPGVEIVQIYLRDYAYAALAAQILGYTGEISPEELKRLRRDGYRGGDRIGKAGIEAAYDTYLRAERDWRRSASTRSVGRSRRSSSAKRLAPATRSG
jgi:hypothetical protein